MAEGLVLQSVIYDETSPSCLRWRFPTESNHKNPLGPDVAGTLDGSLGYWVVNFEGKNYRCHRIVLGLSGVYLREGWYVDHIDGDRSNNKLCNLRLISPSQSAKNKSKQSNNSSGKTGVSWVGRRVKAHWVDMEGRRLYKYFSVAKYGLIPAFAEACKFRELKINELTNASGYTYRHGN